LPQIRALAWITSNGGTFFFGNYTTTRTKQRTHMKLLIPFELAYVTDPKFVSCEQSFLAELLTCKVGKTTLDPP